MQENALEEEEEMCAVYVIIAHESSNVLSVI